MYRRRLLGQVAIMEGCGGDMVSKVNITFDPSLVNEFFCLINGRLDDSLVIPDEVPDDRLR